MDSLSQIELVLSVPAGKTYACLIQHKLYSCPECYQHKTTRFLSPRNSDGRMEFVFQIQATVTLDPRNSVHLSQVHNTYRQRIVGYIADALQLPGMLDSGGQYRFYFLSETMFSGLPLRPQINPNSAEHLYFDLQDLVSGTI